MTCLSYLYSFYSLIFLPCFRLPTLGLIFKWFFKAYLSSMNKELIIMIKSLLHAQYKFFDTLILLQHFILMISKWYSKWRFLSFHDHAHTDLIHCKIHVVSSINSDKRSAKNIMQSCIGIHSLSLNEIHYYHIRADREHHMASRSKLHRSAIVTVVLSCAFFFSRPCEAVSGSCVLARKYCWDQQSDAIDCRIAGKHM